MKTLAGASLITTGFLIILASTGALKGEQISKCTVVGGGTIEPSQQLEVASGTLSVFSAHFLVFEENEKSREIAVPQPDFGEIRGLYRTQDNTVFALGDQVSYQITELGGQDNFLTQPQALPTLTRNKCNRFGDFFGTCYQQQATFSDALSAIFIAGFDHDSNWRSFVLGLTTETLEISSSSYPLYLGDSDGVAIMQGNNGTAILDKHGEFQPCNR